MEPIEQRLKKDGKKLQEKTLRLGQPDEVTFSVFYSEPVFCIFKEDGSRFGKLIQVFRKPEACAERWNEITGENEAILDWLENRQAETPFRERMISTSVGRVQIVRQGYDFRENKDGTT